MAYLHAELEKKIAKTAMGDIIPFLAANAPELLKLRQVEHNCAGGPRGTIVGFTRHQGGTKCNVAVAMKKGDFEHVVGGYSSCTINQIRELMFSRNWTYNWLVDGPREGVVYFVADVRFFMGVKEEKADDHPSRLARARVYVPWHGNGVVVGRNSSENKLLIQFERVDTSYATRVGAECMFANAHWTEKWLMPDDYAGHHYHVVDAGIVSHTPTVAAKLKQAAKNPTEVSDDLQLVRERLYRAYGVSPAAECVDAWMRLIKELDVFVDNHCRFCGAHRGGEDHRGDCQVHIEYRKAADQIYADFMKRPKQTSRDDFLAMFPRRMPPPRKFVPRPEHE